jgi:8-oxo-dGTP diphosphatase
MDDFKILPFRYEMVLDQKLDKRNFRKKVLSLNILNTTKQRKAEGAHRPALLYEFKHRKPEIIEII